MENLSSNLTSSLKSLNTALENSDSPDESLITEAGRLVEIAQDNIFKTPSDQKELHVLGKNLSRNSNSSEVKTLLKKIKDVTIHGYFDGVQVDKNLRADQKSQREQIFWGLGTDWWKQIIDKPCHAFGPEVFDKALHGREAEPGFLQGIREASVFAGKFIGTENSVALYKEIHQAACHHFEVNKKDHTSVLVSGKETGQFKRPSGHQATFPLTKLDPELSYLLTFQKLHKHPDAYSQIGINKMELTYPGIFLDSSNNEIVQKNDSLLKIKLADWSKRVKSVTSEIAMISKEIGLDKPYAHVMWDGVDSIVLVYTPIKQEELECAVDFLFDRFNKKALHLQNELKSNLENANYEELPLVQTQYETDIRQNIAELFQYLEWLHPFPDGQGRTDLILLAKLLTDYGLHPAILEQPYDSSILPFAEWDAKLVIGLENWSREKSKQDV